MKWNSVLCLLLLLSLNSYAFDKYGIPTGKIGTDKEIVEGSWNEAYHDQPMIDANFTGSGTRVDPYQINDKWDLCRLEDQVNAGNDFKGKYFKLLNDIDLSGHVWYPIGVKSSAPFSGRFDGNDKTISNMTIIIHDADNENAYCYGLFGFMKGVIRHLNMTGGNIIFNRTENNQATQMDVGLLCGTLLHNMTENIFGTVYECHVEGSLGGSVGNFYNSQYVGGVVGVAYEPVAIYKCQADVELITQDVTHVGGIVGWASGLPSDFPAGRTNTYDTPCTSYIFDCVANVRIVAELIRHNRLNCGGICGTSNGKLLACVSTGDIKCGLHDSSDLDFSQVNMKMGGLTGINNYNIMSCISMANLKGGKIVGGLIGENANNVNSSLVGNVLNSVFCGNIDSPEAVQTHGLVGSQMAGSRAPFNCLFTGTMHGGTNKAPLSNSSTEKCYSDRNMYDDGSEWSCYKYTDEFSDVDATWFVNQVDFNVDWHSIATWTPQSKSVSLDFIWERADGFYPRFKVDQWNIANNSWDDDMRLFDYVITTAAEYFSEENPVALRTPSNYQKYSWLASVPMNVPDHNFRADFIDTPFSLAIKQQPLDEIHQKVATFSIAEDMLTVTGEANAQTATPKDNVAGSVMLTVTSDDNVSRQICLDIYTRHQWDGKVAKAYDGGNGTQGNPYLIHNARQLMKAFTNNASGQYYRLTKDIWFNENLLTDTGEPKSGNIAWDHQGKRETNNWQAHLDGDSHLIHGLYSKEAFGLLEKIHKDASIENVGFVDCLVWSPESDVETDIGYRRPFGFLTPVIGGTAIVKNCLFDGVVKERRSNTSSTDFSGFVHTIDYTDAQNGPNPIFEDCVLSVVAKSDIADRLPEHAFISHENQAASHIIARRVLVLNNSMAMHYHISPGIDTEACHFPEGYLPYTEYYKDAAALARSVAEMTNGTFFSGDGYDKWTVRQGVFPMLTSFAATDYGKLMSLPVYASNDNRLADMNYLMDFYPGAATWQSSNTDVAEVDKDIRVIEPKTSGSIYVVRSMSDAKMLMPVKTAADITRGINFSDIEAKKFCLAHYDANGDNAISLSELKSVTLEQFQQDMNVDDGNAFDNDGNLIELFPEFRYFASVDALGTSFQEKDKLQQLAMSGRITALTDDAFRGTASMTSFTIPFTVKTFGAHPFYNSGLENFEVESDHDTFAADGGLLTDKDKTLLLCWPSGRKAFDVVVPEEQSPSNAPRRSSAGTAVKGIEVPANLTAIASHAIYKVPDVNAVFLSTADYDYETVKQPQANAITPKDGVQMRYYVKDGTHDSDVDGDGEATGEGNGHLLKRYKESSLWSGKTIDRYWELEVNKDSKDDENRYWATMYIGFDTQLPEGLTAYIVDKEVTQFSSPTLKLHKIGKKVPMLTPVVILAESPGTYKLFPSKEAKYPEIGMSLNMLDGVNRNGFTPYQGDANDGGCLTLGRNKSGKIGFFIYKGKGKIPAFRSYLAVNKVEASEFLLDADDASTTGISEIERMRNGENERMRNGENEKFYDLQGRKYADGTQPSAKSLYINNGRKFVKP